MATLTIRDFDDQLKAALRVRAAQHGRSMESEVREILRAALERPFAGPGMGTRIRERFSEIGGPLPRPSVNPTELIRRRRNLPRVDVDTLRSDVDSVMNSSL